MAGFPGSDTVSHPQQMRPLRMDPCPRPLRPIQIPNETAAGLVSRLTRSMLRPAQLADLSLALGKERLNALVPVARAGHWRDGPRSLVCSRAHKRAECLSNLDSYRGPTPRLEFRKVLR